MNGGWVNILIGKPGLRKVLPAGRYSRIFFILPRKISGFIGFVK